MSDERLFSVVTQDFTEDEIEIIKNYEKRKKDGILKEFVVIPRTVDKGNGNDPHV